MNILYELWHFFLALQSIYLRPKIMFFGRNKMNINQEVFNLEKDQIEIAHEYKCLEIDSYPCGYFEQSSKRQRIVGTESLMGTLREKK